jgi:cyclase
MYRPRIIPVLLLDNDRLVKSVQFKNYHYIGDPINAVKIYNEMLADEIVVLDISATKENRTIDIEFVKTLGEEANMSFSVGGGIKTLEEIQKLLAAGAERVIIGHQATQDMEFIRKACQAFGSSSISVCIDIQKNFFGKHIVCSFNASKTHKLNPLDYALALQKNGVGELIIQSVSRDGTQKGFDLSYYKEIIEHVEIPVVCLGGAQSIADMRYLYQNCNPNGIGAGSLFVYQGTQKGVLINYFNSKQKQEIYVE